MQVPIALIQNHCVENKATNLATAVRLVRHAARDGARILCLQELYNTLYFCLDQDTRNFDLAEPADGPAVRTMQTLAAELNVVIIVPFFERRAPGIYHNTAAIIDADGSVLGYYRKMHIPQDPGFEEKFYFTPGDLGYRAWRTRHGTIGVLICWDQWYPEAARLTAMAGAQILFYPTAIGWLPAEKASLGEAQHCAWETVQRGHAVANGCYVAAANRIGREGETEFWGQSFVADFYGQVAVRASLDCEEIVHYTCDLSALEDFRRIWPFFRDRRIDSYGDITKRLVD
ncbi:MAG: carbon-nitrogen hydrolase [Verrucomicrobiota bacterium]|nr:carbon-nitrogen hydrolase [Verrucomicrobiota bacterium]